ncbi:MAG: alpha-galactosidase [Immundisolibacterales bacterium]|nr:alpha-galactosidase [Immundisolibacterales bacterium]
MQAWRLDDGHQTLVLAARDRRLPEVAYWGAPLPADTDCAALARAGRIDVTGGMLDESPDLSICPEAGRSFPGQPGLVVRGADGGLLLPRFRFRSESSGGDAGSLTLVFSDRSLDLTYSARFDTDASTGVMTLRATLEAGSPVRLSWLAAPVLPAPQLADEMIDFAGRWCGEFRPVATPWGPGVRHRENRTGRTGHEHFPGLVVPGRGATNARGVAYAFHYGWSGGHRMVAEELPDGRRQIQFGNAMDTELGASTRFDTAPLFVVRSDAGINGCATAFQRHVHDRIVRFPQPDRPRPVHYNCWEAVYFDHDLPVLRDIAARAAALGAERFVLDDGWFGRRDDDTTSLGDWEVDPRKFPEGLGPLVEHVRDLGMTFGLWFEPEMVSRESNLYRAHPDWALGPAEQTLGRGQMVLDMAREDVRDHLFTSVAALLSRFPVDCVKLDHNRVLPVPDAAQTRGTYALLDRLRDTFPGVEIESSASGGGRIDFGILARAHRVWLSDSNDALERLRIQHHAALFLPGAVTGSHVGPRRCHTSGRSQDISFRAWVAAQRHMGLEMDPRELTEHEVEVLSGAIAWYKRNRDWLHRADILRLDSPDPAVIGEQHLARDGSRFAVFLGRAEAGAPIAPRPQPLIRLEPDARYRVRLVNRADVPRLSRSTPLLGREAVEAPGAWLTSQGLTLPWSFPERMWVLEGERL